MSDYDTQFTGDFYLTKKKLSPQLNKYLKFFSIKKRLTWRGLPEEFGQDGEFYYEDMDDEISEHMFGVKISEYVPVKISFYKSPNTQPNSWCNWIPSKDGERIVWNMRKNFNDYVEWLNYIINNFLAPRGYVLDGCMSYAGDCSRNYISVDDTDDMSEDSADDDYGFITVDENVVSYTGPIGLWEDNTKIVEDVICDENPRDSMVIQSVVGIFTIFWSYIYFLYGIVQKR